MPDPILRRGLALLAAFTAVVTAPGAYAQPAEAWTIGPIIRGRNYSVGMPLQPTPARQGWFFDFPYPDVAAGHVHYLTFRHGPLLGRSRIVMRYRIDAARGARFVPREDPSAPATVSLFFQRAGDSWSGRRHEHFRWYAPDQTLRALGRGEFEVSASLDDPNWISVWGRPAAENPEAFRAALAQTDRVGFVLGWRNGRGHGVHATAPARFTLLSYRVL